MKKKFAIFNLVLMAFVLITIGYQSLHAFSHQHFSVGHSHVHHDGDDVHQHTKQFSDSDQENHEDNCSICDFHFDFFLAPQEISYRLYFPFKPIPYTFSITERNMFFSGSLFALRAPPAVV